ncbi:hypothetical protein NSQ82_14685 [Caldifermentibacillus hisashii]|uniref:hypothetical protein n=1 Tax=Caldifermentibacillus hisashii TaxID=996558 RepID=UPI0031B6E9E0
MYIQNKWNSIFDWQKQVRKWVVKARKVLRRQTLAKRMTMIFKMKIHVGNN